MTSPFWDGFEKQASLGRRLRRGAEVLKGVLKSPKVTVAVDKPTRDEAKHLVEKSLRDTADHTIKGFEDAGERLIKKFHESPKLKKRHIAAAGLVGGGAVGLGSAVGSAAGRSLTAQRRERPPYG